MSRPMPRSRASDRGILLSSSRRSARSQKHGATRARRGGMPARVAAMTKRGCGYPPAAVGDPWITAARPCLLRAGRFPVLWGTGKARTLTPTLTPHTNAAHAPRADSAHQGESTAVKVWQRGGMPEGGTSSFILSIDTCMALKQPIENRTHNDRHNEVHKA
jgi:hypothetical protein